MAKKKQLPPKYQVWVNARQRLRLSHAHIQMARELGLNPKKLGQKANDRQETWKVPLAEFIERLYLKRFGKTRPDEVRSIEQIVQGRKQKQAQRKANRLATQGAVDESLAAQAVDCESPVAEH